MSALISLISILHFPECRSVACSDRLTSRDFILFFLHLIIHTHTLYWNLIALQCYVNFCCTMKWIRSMYTYIPSLLSLLPTPCPIAPNLVITEYWAELPVLYKPSRQLSICRAGISRWKSLSRVWLFATPWTIQCMEFSRPEHWSGEPFPSPGDLPKPGIEPGPPHCRRILCQLSHKGNPLYSDFPQFNK